MKFLYTLILSLISFGAFAQYYIYETFESPYDDYRLNFYVDTVNNSNNLWQIGKPQKTTFDSAYSYPNVIVTDTLNEYPVNDTSIFYLSIGGDYSSFPSLSLLNLSFYYQLDIDSLSIAKIELSGDMGLNWINPMTEDTTYMFYWHGGKPRLDKSTNGWKGFNLNMETWSQSYPGSFYDFPHYRTSDTVIYRFTFISGDSAVHHDGWMMDDFIVENIIASSVDEVNEISTSVFPNPTKGTIYLRPNFITSSKDYIEVFNMQGQQVYSTVPVSNIPINLPLPDGVYALKYYGASGVATSRVVIIK